MSAVCWFARYVPVRRLDLGDLDHPGIAASEPVWDQRQGGGQQCRGADALYDSSHDEKLTVGTTAQAAEASVNTAVPHSRLRRKPIRIWVA
jgi:hypothetical protein